MSVPPIKRDEPSRSETPDGFEQYRADRQRRESIRDTYESIRESLQSDEPGDRNLGHPQTCWNCGYGLRGLETRGVCPECTKSVFGSRDDRFRAGLRWARRTRIAFWLGIAAFSLSLLVGPLSWVMGVPALLLSGHLTFVADRGHLRYAHKRLQWVALGFALASVALGGLFLVLGVAVP